MAPGEGYQTPGGGRRSGAGSLRLKLSPWNSMGGAGMPNSSSGLGSRSASGAWGGLLPGTGAGSNPGMREGDGGPSIGGVAWGGRRVAVA